MGVAIVENNVTLKGKYPAIRYRVEDVLLADISTLPRQYLVEPDYMQWWMNRHNPQKMERRMPENQFKTEFSWYTLKPFENLLLANVSSRDDRGVVVSLLYGTGEFSVLTLADKEETAFIEFCLTAAEIPIISVGPEYIRVLGVEYK